MKPSMGYQFKYNDAARLPTASRYVVKWAEGAKNTDTL